MTDQFDHDNVERDTELGHEQLSLDTYETTPETDDQGGSESSHPLLLEGVGELLTEIEAMTGDTKMTEDGWAELDPEARARMVETRLELVRRRLHDEQTQGVNEHAYAYFD